MNLKTNNIVEIELGKICKEIYRYPSYYGIDYVADGMPEIRGELILDNGDINIDQKQLRFISQETSKKFPRTILEPYDLVMSVRGTIGKIGLVPEKLKGANITANLIRISPYKEIVNPRYLWHFMRTKHFRAILNHISPSTTIKTIRAPDLKKTKIPLPSLEEQKRIAEILDRADAIRQKRKRAIALTEELARSTFLEMFGDPVINPKGWEVKKLDALLLDIESGWSPKCESRQAEPNEWGVLKLDSISSGYFDPEENKAMFSDSSPRPDLEVKNNDLLFSRKNTYQLVGATAFVHQTRSKLMLPDLIFRLRLTNQVDPIFLWQALSTKTMRYELSRLASGTSGSMPNISKKRLRTLPVIVPPLELQIKYNKLINKILCKKDRQNLAFTYSNNFFNSLLQRAFKGEL